jgi:hypothetical protein
MDKSAFCNNYVYSCVQVIFIFVDKLSLLWCLFCLRRYVCWLCLYVKDRYGEPERGEWMGADKNSSRRRWRLQQDVHGFQHTSPTHYLSWPSPRSHWSANEPRNQLPTSPTRERSGTLNLESTDRHRSDRWAPPVRPVPAGETWQLPQKGSTPVRPVQHTGPTGLSPKAPKHQTGLPSSKLTQTRNSCNTGQQQTHPNVHPSKYPTRVAPVRPVKSTSQTGVA